VLTRVVSEYDLVMDWYGFELHPSTPKGGMDVAKLFRGADPVAMAKRTTAFAASFGVTMGHPMRLPNTRRALAIAELARDRGVLDPFRHAAMEAHWNRGLDIEQDDVLEALASEAGLDPSEALAAADSPAFQARVDAMGDEARRYGVTGIPTWVALPEGWKLGDPRPPPGSPQPIRVVGCQPAATVEAALAKAGVRKRAAPAR
jgi:predicted DsbA family dithiol-disulfide isomerase